MPPFSALLAGATWHVAGDHVPLIWADLANHGHQVVILALVPGLLARLLREHETLGGRIRTRSAILWLHFEVGVCF